MFQFRQINRIWHRFDIYLPLHATIGRIAHQMLCSSLFREIDHITKQCKTHEMYAQWTQFDWLNHMQFTTVWRKRRNTLTIIERYVNCILCTIGKNAKPGNRKWATNWIRIVLPKFNSFASFQFFFLCLINRFVTASEEQTDFCLYYYWTL